MAWIIDSAFHVQVLGPPKSQGRDNLEVSRYFRSARWWKKALWGDSQMHQFLDNINWRKDQKIKREYQEPLRLSLPIWWTRRCRFHALKWTQQELIWDGNSLEDRWCLVCEIKELLLEDIYFVLDRFYYSHGDQHDVLCCLWVKWCSYSDVLYNCRCNTDRILLDRASLN